MTLTRVAVFSPYALSVFGGVQEQALAMSRELARRGVEVALFAPDDADDGPYDTPAVVRTFGRRLRVPANGSRAPVTLSWRAGRRARRELRRFRPDVVHFHEPFAPVLGYATALQHRYPAVATVHRAGWGPGYYLTRPWLRHVAREIDRVAAVSPSAAQTYQRAVGVSPTVLYNGFETERFRVYPRERTVVPLVLYVGRLEPRKGVGTLVEAVKRYGEGWRTVVLGDGPDRPSLLRQASGTRIEFLGAVSDADKRRWLRRANVTVAPSLYGESFGMVVLEPMAAESRVVASDIEGYREAAAGLAELFAPGDADALGAAISRALVDDAGLIAHARRHAEGWSMSGLMDRYVTLYEAAVSSRAAAADR